MVISIYTHLMQLLCEASVQQQTQPFKHHLLFISLFDSITPD